ncbi:MAG: MFS transporter [Thermoplasmatales archaeon]|nr:MFS transporter [Thermoplasmatales archaeon]MCW6171020.1 MFS transporter [Thermoplasmatales archaeon]
MEEGSETRRKNFKLTVSNLAISRAGTSAFSLMILWITLQLTHIPAIAGLADGMFTLPLFFSFFVGSFIDRSRDKKLIAIIASIIRSISIFLLFIAVSTHILAVIVFFIFLCVVIMGFTSDISNSVRAIWVKVFLKDEEYQKGSAWMMGIGSLAEMAGFIASGIFIYIGFLKGISALFVVLVASCVPIIFIIQKPDQRERQSVKNDMKKGLKFLKETKIMQQMIFLMIIANLAVAMMGIAFTVLVEEIFKLNAIYFSIVFILVSLGIVLGSMPGSRVKGKLGFIIIPLLLVTGAMFVSIAFLRSIYLTYIPVLVIGFCVGMINPPTESVLIKRIPEEMMARSMGMVNTMAISVTFFSGTIGGLIIQFTSIFYLFLIIGSLVILSGFGIFFMKELRDAPVK